VPLTLTTPPDKVFCAFIHGWPENPLC
jgi:hypothetical protein